MNRDHVDRFCSRVCAHVSFSPDHAAITAELTAHLEDHAAALEARGFPSDVAVQQAVDAMGDPKEIGKELDKSHSPFLGWFQIWFRAAVWTLLLLSILTAAYSLLHSTSSLRLPSQAEAEWLQTHRSFPQVAGELDPQAVYQGADYRFSVERAILLDTHTGLRLDCLLRVSWRNPWLPPPNAGALLRAEDDRGNEYPQFQNRPFLTGRYLHGGPLPGASPLPVRYYELSICQVDPKAETITLLLDPFGAVEARLTIPLREEKAHG